VNLNTRLQLLGVLAFFLAALRWRALQRALSTRLLVFLGFVSYPLYLIHGRVLVVFTYWQWIRFPSMPALLTPVAPMLLSIGLAFLMARFGEPALRSWLKTTIVPGDRGPVVAMPKS
jgi:peptidoglycan/LPS O-acetylase OafA/YrhL